MIDQLLADGPPWRKTAQMWRENTIKLKHVSVEIQLKMEDLINGIPRFVPSMPLFVSVQLYRTETTTAN